MLKYCSQARRNRLTQSLGKEGLTDSYFRIAKVKKRVVRNALYLHRRLLRNWGRKKLRQYLYPTRIVVQPKEAGAGNCDSKMTFCSRPAFV